MILLATGPWEGSVDVLQAWVQGGALSRHAFMLFSPFPHGHAFSHPVLVYQNRIQSTSISRPWGLRVSMLEFPWGIRRLGK